MTDEEMTQLAIGPRVPSAFRLNSTSAARIY